MDIFYTAVTALLVGLGLGGFAGHAAGYARRGYVEHARRMTYIARSAARVRTPE